MAQVIVRNLDVRVVAALKRKAKLHGCSLEQELRDILSRAARPSAGERAALAGVDPRGSRHAVTLVVDASVAWNWFVEEAG